MLQSLLLTALLIELLLYVWLGGHLAQGGMAPAAIAAIVALIALWWRATHALASYVVAAVMRVADKRVLPLGNSLAALANEFGARAVSFNVSQPFVRIAMGPEPAGRSETMPVLLVHGFFSNRGMWVGFRKALRKLGVGPVYTVTLEPILGSIDVMAEQLAGRIEEIVKDSGQERIAIVAHSMGGLVTRKYLATHGPARLAALVTLGSPHHGTRLAGVGMGECTRQMKCGCPWLAALEAAEAERPHGVPALSVYTLNDDIVYPPESAVLPWATNVPVSAVGHIGMLFSEPVAMRVAAWIRDLPAARSQAPSDRSRSNSAL